MEFIKYTLSDGYTLSARYWRNDSTDGILYIHGIQSHGLWFEISSSALADMGFSVLLPDRRGSGLSKENRGDINRYQQWLDDLDELVEFMSADLGLKKIHILAVSWGGKLAMALSKTIPHKLTSITLIAPGMFPRVDVSLSDKIAIASAIISNPAKQFPIPLNQPELFTDNPERQNFIRNDKLKLTKVSARFLYNSRKLDGFILKSPQRLKCPSKLFLAGRDKIIDNCKTLKFYRKLKSSVLKEVTFYSQASHTIEFEADNRRFLADLKDWFIRCKDI